MSKQVKRGIGYGRVSTEEQKLQGTSTKAQKSRCIEYMEKLSEKDPHYCYEIVEFISDDGYSGKNTKRPGYKRIWRLVEDEAVGFIVTSELSRVSRSVKDFLELVEHCEKHSVDVIIIGMDFDTTTPMGMVFLTILMALAQFERELTAHRTRENALTRLKTEGRINGSSSIWGLIRDKDSKEQFRIDEDEVSDLRKIFELFLKHGRKITVIEEASRLGLTRKNGEKLTPHRLDRIIENANWRYRGLWKYVDKTTGEIVPVKLAHGPVIEDELLDRVIAQAKDYKDKFKRQGTRKFCYYLSNLLVFEDGTPFKGHSANGRGGRYRYYKNAVNKTSIKVEEIHKLIIERFKAYVANSKVLIKMIEEEFANRVLYVGNIEKEIRSVKRQIKSKKDTLEQLEEKGFSDIGFDNFQKLYSRSESTLETLKLRLEGLEEQKVNLSKKHNLETTEARLKKFYECFSKGSETQKRDMLEMIFKKVVVLKNNKLKLILWGSNEPQGGRNNFDGFLYEQGNGVTDGARTHDNQNHNLALYQLNYGHHKNVELFIID